MTSPREYILHTNTKIINHNKNYFLIFPGQRHARVHQEASQAVAAPTEIRGRSVGSVGRLDNHTQIHGRLARFQAAHGVRHAEQPRQHFRHVQDLLHTRPQIQQERPRRSAAYERRNREPAEPGAQVNQKQECQKEARESNAQKEIQTHRGSDQQAARRHSRRLYYVHWRKSVSGGQAHF